MDIKEANGRKFIVGNSQFHFLRMGYAIQEKLERKLSHPLKWRSESRRPGRAGGLVDPLRLRCQRRCRLTVGRNSFHDNRRL